MRIIWYECKMDVLRTFRYKMGLVSDLVIYTLLLCFFFWSNTGQSFQELYGVENYQALLLLGYMDLFCHSNFHYCFPASGRASARHPLFQASLPSSASDSLSGRPAFLGARPDYCCDHLFCCNIFLFRGTVYSNTSDRGRLFDFHPRHVRNRADDRRAFSVLQTDRRCCASGAVISSFCYGYHSNVASHHRSFQRASAYDV